MPLEWSSGVIRGHQESSGVIMCLHMWVAGGDDGEEGPDVPCPGDLRLGVEVAPCHIGERFGDGDL